MITGMEEHRSGSVIPDRMMHFLWALVLLPLIFGVLVFVVSLNMYRFLGNSLEVAIALVCMISCLYAYRTWSERIILLLAAFACGGYALSNTFWYLYDIAFPEPGAFFTIAELGFLGFMLFFIVAFRIEFPKKICPVSSRIAVWGLFLTIAIITLVTTAITLDTLMFTVLLLVIALFMDTAIEHGVYRYRILWSGICLWSFTLLLYGLRETLIDPLVSSEVDAVEIHSFVVNLEQLQFVLHIIGPLILLSFLLIQLGIFAYLNTAEH